jgi:hypothetical protein
VKISVRRSEKLLRNVKRKAKATLRAKLGYLSYSPQNDVALMAINKKITP